MLLDLCIKELEDVVQEPFATSLPQPVIHESQHPYLTNSNIKGRVHIPGAEALKVEFDPRCSTAHRGDTLLITDSQGTTIAQCYGHDSSEWSHDVCVIGDELKWSFHSDKRLETAWGFRLVTPSHK